MKLKYLFSASAMIALMAACSNEEFETLTNETATNRPSAGQVEIVSTLADADSRATWTGAGWKFNEESDRFGVMLMDVWNESNEGHTTIDDYTFVDYIHTNYPFHSEDGGYTWQSPENAPLSEGNYFFTYPFDPTYQYRGRVYFEVPNVQSNVTEDGVVNAAWPIKYYQKYWGYAFIPAQSGVNKVDVSFHSLFANPKFKIMNATGMNIRMIKMLVRTHQDGKADEPVLMPTKLQLAPLAAGFNNVNKAYAAGELSAAEETAALFSNATTVENGFFGEDKLNGVYEYVLDCGDNYVVPAGEFFRLSAVMPAGEYWNFDIYAFVEIQNSEKTTGVIRLTGLDKSDWSNMDTQNGSMQTVLKPGITQVLTASFDANSVANLGLKDFTVVTSEDLAFVVNLKAKDGGRDLVVIKTLGDDVVLTKEVYDLISNVNRKGIKWQIDGTIVIPADAAVDAIDQLTTGQGGVKTTIINKGTQVLTKDLVNCDVINEGQITGAVTVYGNVTNAAGAEMTVTTVNGDVDNKGIITIGTVNGNVHNGKYMAEKDNESIAPVTAATATIGRLNMDNTCARNWGIFNLNSSDDNTGISNKYCGKMNLMGGYVYFITNRGGEVNVVEESKVYGLTNDGGVVNVNDNLTITNALANTNDEHYTSATINVAQNAALKGINGDINNDRGAVINVTGKLSDNVYNAGLINVIEDGIVVVNSVYNNIAGTIDVTRANATTTAQAAKCVNSTSMYFAYTVGEEKTAAELVAALKARISDVNYGKNPIKLTWGAASASEFEGKLDTPNATDVTINNSLTLTGDTRFQDVETDKFVVNGFLTIANGCSLEVPESICVVVNGTLKANNWAKLKGSDVTVCGEGEVITASGVTVEWKKLNGSNITWTGNN